MGLVQEFKEFAMKGNVVDLAVGVIMGAGFGKIVSSLVSDVLMPPIGYLIGGVSFKDLKYTLPKITIKIPDPDNVGKFKDSFLPETSINYGLFLQSAFDFLIIAICVFALVKMMNSLKRKPDAAPAPAAPPEDVVLLKEIRDLLKAK